jgi:acyl-CoA thioesterase
MDVRGFLDMQPAGDDLHWRLHVRRELSTPGEFLFGGCGLGAAIVALEQAAGRPTVWATAQYLSYAPTGSDVDWEVILAVVGGHVTQGRAVGRVDDREILTVNAALGQAADLDLGDVWVEPPVVPAPEDCPPRTLPKMFTNTILDSIDVRIAKGTRFEDIERHAGAPDSALWARVPGHIDVTAGTLAIFGDYVTGGVGQPLGRRVMSRSLDNTIRVAQLVRTEWVLCDIRIHAVVGGYAQGVGFLWSEDGVLLATAGQSMSIRPWPADLTG